VLVLRVPYRLFTFLLLLITCAACRSANTGSAPAIVQPGAPGASSRVVTPEKAADLSKVGYTAADVKFMQGMIHHHAQALDMTALVADRTSRDDMRKLAQRIEVSQADEIKMMQRWLEVRGQEVPGPHAHHAPGAPLMPGMLTPEEMAQLAAAKGPEFDRLFLEGMIKHHGGALTMVQELFATPGAGQESEMFAFASDVDADQRMEIDRMRGMLAVR
jgi:uncharacterized protein (DUF305 family)